MTINEPQLATDAEQQQAETSPFHYYDLHPTPEDLMGESPAQSYLAIYLINVLRWLYRAEQWFIVGNLNIYQARRKYEVPIVPDVALFKGVVVANHALRRLRSWRLYEPESPPPQVVFEFASEETWLIDVAQKPARYQQLDTQEYYAYDPNDPPYYKPEHGRLRGWRLIDGVMVEQQKDARGWLWSDELESWLVPDGDMLRLYTADGEQRLTGEEAARSLAARERRAKETERHAKETERHAKEVERHAKETERHAKEAAWAKLRELGIDPEQL